VIGFTKTWARELGPKGIRVNGVCPGFIATEMVKAMPENILQDIERRSWLGRLGTPEEIANVYLFLASNEASFINGQTIAVDGGFDASGVGLPTLRKNRAAASASKNQGKKRKS
jgi:3-oxoacyl-[acyl-carrier protein] reductase